MEKFNIFIGRVTKNKTSTTSEQSQQGTNDRRHHQHIPRERLKASCFLHILAAITSRMWLRLAHGVLTFNPTLFLTTMSLPITFKQKFFQCFNKPPSNFSEGISERCKEETSQCESLVFFAYFSFSFHPTGRWSTRACFPSMARNFGRSGLVFFSRHCDTLFVSWYKENTGTKCGLMGLVDTRCKRCLE